MSAQLASLPEYLTAHLELTLLALGVGALVSVPLGILVHRVGWLEGPVLGVASVIQTIPGLALLAIMVPLLAALGLRSIGYLPAFIGLTLYSLLPMLRNTVTGLAGVDPALIEAARGVGMTPNQRLRLVELPLALPVIIAGLRTATVWTVGMATLSTPVGAPSLGNYIFSGLQTRNEAAVLVGCVAAAGLALVLDGLVHLLGKGVQQRSRGLVGASLAVLGLFAAYAASGPLRDAWRAPEAPPVRVGAKTFTEQYVLSEALALWLERQAGRRSEIVSSLGSTVAFDALVAGELDAYVDYSGTIWATILKRHEVPENRREVVDSVRRELLERYGVAVAAALGFENTYAFAMRGEDARRLGIARLSELAGQAPRLALGGDYEFFSRPEWGAVQAAYALRFAQRRSMDSALMYSAVAQGEVDVISAFSTDGRIAAFDLRVLEDDRGAIPPYDAIVLVGRRLRDDPAALAALSRLDGSIDAALMRTTNQLVDGEGLPPSAAAERLLSSARFSPTPRTP